jgi:hypothetical protein
LLNHPDANQHLKVSQIVDMNLATDNLLYQAWQQHCSSKCGAQCGQDSKNQLEQNHQLVWALHIAYSRPILAGLHHALQQNVGLDLERLQDAMKGVYARGQRVCVEPDEVTPLQNIPHQKRRIL